VRSFQESNEERRPGRDPLSDASETSVRPRSNAVSFIFRIEETKIKKKSDGWKKK
jgi:hypothetical protein|tara:strand:- start:1857 stop:2021 length:165 start_codon:yes stop_codon:yes gene_type:complete